MNSPDGQRQEVVSTLDRSHLKGIVQKNALESAAYVKLARHLENQKRAFVRQNTRDEGEMKNLLCRLQMEQQVALSDAEVKADNNLETNEVSDTGAYPEPEVVANPYPVTIVPRFGVTPCIKQTTGAKNVYNRSGSSLRSVRRKSVEYEDIQESLSSMNISNIYSVSDIAAKSSTRLSHDDHTPRDWLASPDAISSVRRMRKSVTEQTQLRIRRQTLTEIHSDQWVSHSSCPPSVSHSRSNSLKDKRPKSKDTDASSTTSGMRRRGNSLKERKTNVDQTMRKRLSRSSSMLYGCNTPEHKKLERRSLTKDVEPGTEASRVTRKDSKAGDKGIGKCQPSEDPASNADTESPRRLQINRHKTVEVVFGGQSSPLSSPYWDTDSFKF